MSVTLSEVPTADASQGRQSEAAEDFLEEFSRALLAGTTRFYSDNVDPYRFPAPPAPAGRRFRRAVRDRLIRLARRAGFTFNRSFDVMSASQNLAEVLRRAEGLERSNHRLADQASRRTLIEILCYRVLGHERVRLSRNQPAYWEAARHAELDLVRQRRTFPIRELDGALNLYDLHPEGYPLALHAHLLNILNTFVVQQYRYDKAGQAIFAHPGDVVIDGGGCWGDTALYFAHLAGPHGRVYCFEFVPENLNILRENLKLNPELGPRVQIVQNALWHSSGETLEFSAAGPGTSLVAGAGAQPHRVQTLTIDELVAKEGLDRVDFLKLDIEGAELSALRGAEQTLRRFRPRLAIALYHRLDDFVTIPDYLHDLGLDYELYLDHFTVHQEETVLFARSRPS